MPWTPEGLRDAVRALWKDVRAHAVVAGGVVAGSILIEVLLRMAGV